MVVPIGDTHSRRWVSRRPSLVTNGGTPCVLPREAADDVAASSGASAHYVVHMSAFAPQQLWQVSMVALRGRSGCPLFAAHPPPQAGAGRGPPVHHRDCLSGGPGRPQTPGRRRRARQLGHAAHILGDQQRVTATFRRADGRTLPVWLPWSMDAERRNELMAPG